MKMSMLVESETAPSVELESVTSAGPGLWLVNFRDIPPPAAKAAAEPAADTEPSARETFFTNEEGARHTRRPVVERKSRGVKKPAAKAVQVIKSRAAKKSAASPVEPDAK